jgi:hypothetical protein
LKDADPLLRFTIRDVLWLTAVVAVLVAWRVGHNNSKQERALLRQLQGEITPMEWKLRRFGHSRVWQADDLARLSSKLDARSPMAEERVKEIDQRLTQLEWTYNPEAEQFQFTGPSVSINNIEWEAVLISLPDLSVNEMLAYKYHKRQQWLREQAKEPAK